MTCQKPDDCKSKEKATGHCFTGGYRIEPGKVYVVECPHFKKKETIKP